MPQKNSDSQGLPVGSRKKADLQGLPVGSQKKADPPGLPVGGSKRKVTGNDTGSIKWTGQLSKLLAYKMRDKYKTKWLCGTRIAVAKQWAIDLGLGDLDPKGFKTKAAVGILIKKYREALDLSNRTGFGDTTHTVNGIEVPLTALAQLKAICPHWEIFDSFMRSEFESNINQQAIGLTESGPQGSLELNTGGLRDEDTTADEDEEDSTTPDIIVTASHTTTPHTTTINALGNTIPDTIITASHTTASHATTVDLLDNTTLADITTSSTFDFGDDEFQYSSDKDELDSTKTSKNKRDLLSAIQDAREKMVKKKKLNKLEHEIDIYNKVLDTRNRRLAVDEMKYRARAGEKSKEQRQHELALMELEVKREQYKKEKEELRWKQLQYQKEACVRTDTSSSAPRSRSESISDDNSNLDL